MFVDKLVLRKAHCSVGVSPLLQISALKTSSESPFLSQEFGGDIFLKTSDHQGKETKITPEFCTSEVK